MAMDASKMAQTIIDELSKTDENSSANDAMSAFSKGVKSHLEDNMEIDFSWSATLPSPPNTPDPKTSYTGSIVFSSFNVSPPSDMALLGVLMAPILAGGEIKSAPGFLVPPTHLLSKPFSTTQEGGDDQKKAMEALCEEIISGIKGMVNSTKPLPGTHGTYTLPTPGAIMTDIN